MYVVVTRAEPMEAYLHRKALVRYAAAPFELSEASFEDRRIHFTAKRETSFRFCTFADLRAFIRETRGTEVDASMWEDLCCMIHKVVMAGGPKPPVRASGFTQERILDFEFFGFIWLIVEVPLALEW